MASVLRLLAAAAPNGLPLSGRLIRGVLGRVFGPSPFDPDADPGDPGLFGPGSASWRVMAEPASIVGGVRAVLVQLLHPLAVAGVADHSRFRDDPLGRLHGTSAYVTTTTFGSLPQALRISRIVRAAHRPVTGTAPDGRPYRAADPRLLTWVSVALTSSFLAADGVYAPRPVDGATADAFVAEQSRAAALLDERVDLDALAADRSALTALGAGRLPLPMLLDGTLPASVAELEATLRSFRPELRLDAQGRDAARFLLWPDLPAPLRAAYLPLLVAALATLAPHERRLLGLPASGAVARPVAHQTRALLSALRLALGTSPSQRLAARRVAAEPA